MTTILPVLVGRPGSMSSGRIRLERRGSSARGDLALPLEPEGHGGCGAGGISPD